MSSPPKQPLPTTTTMKDDKIIRGKLLSRLGIYDGELVPQRTQPLTAAELRRNRIMKGMGVSVIAVQPPPDGSAIRMPLEGVKPFREPLKVDGEMQTTTTTTTGSGRKTRIAFQGDVEVMPIPTRYEYSDRIKSQIWSNRHELQENAERNALEFASEGWDWRSVTDDEGMYICSQSGELVHPIHLQQFVAEHREASAAEAAAASSSATSTSSSGNL